MKQMFDVAILGGGPAGSSSAISLLQKGCSVAIIEKSDYTQIRTGETIQPQISSLLRDLKINEEIFQHHLPSNAIQSVWGDSSLKENNFFFSPFGHGWHLNRLKFDKQLISHAKKSGATLFTPCVIKTITQIDSGIWSIGILNQHQIKTIHARFIIDATGRSSLLVKHQGGFRKNIDHLIGLVSIPETNCRAKQTNFTLIEPVKTGWWYSADIPGNKTVVAYMTDADLYKKKSCNKEDFFNRLFSKTTYTKEKSPGSKPDNIVMHAANSYLMSKTHGKNWLAIGDAAMAFDPLSSQGIYKAIKSGIGSAKLINEHFNGNSTALQNYSNSLNAAFEKYLQQRKLYYGDEKRWPGALFWKRRHADTKSNY